MRKLISHHIEIHTHGEKEEVKKMPRVVLSEPPLYIPECMDYRIVPIAFGYGTIHGEDDYVLPCPGREEYCARSVVIWGESIKYMKDDEEFLEFMARVAREILPRVPGYEYYFVKRVAKQWSRCLRRFLSNNPKERIRYELERLAKQETPVFVYESKRHLVLNPLWLLKKIASLARILEPYEFADIFYELYQFYQENIERCAEDIARGLEQGGLCHIGSGSFWCEEAILLLSYKLERKVERLVDTLT